MPQYNYKCISCSNEETKTFSMKDYPQHVDCSQCESSMKITISRTSFALKGSGWASQGYSAKRSQADSMNPKKIADSIPG